MIALPAAEGVLDASGIAPRIEALLPSGARTRQLTVRTLLLGMMLALADGRPAHLTRVHQALTSLPGDEQRRLGVLADWKDGPHPLTYRQAEYTFSLVTGRARQGPAGRAAVAGAAGGLRRPARSRHPAGIQGRRQLAGRGLERPGDLLPAPAARNRRLRRPRGVLGAPQEQPAPR